MDDQNNNDWKNFLIYIYIKKFSLFNFCDYIQFYLYICVHSSIYNNSIYIIIRIYIIRNIYIIIRIHIYIIIRIYIIRKFFQSLLFWSSINLGIFLYFQRIHGNYRRN